MRKTVISISGIILVIIAILLLTPLIMGPWSISAYQNQLSRIIQTLYAKNHVTVKVLRYHRSWFSAKADVRLTIKLGPLKTPSQNQSHQLLIKQHLIFGPIIFTRNLLGRSKLYIAKIVVKNKSNTPGLKARSFARISFDNTLFESGSADHIVVRSPQQTIIINNLKNRLIYSPKNKTMRGDFNIASISSTQQITQKQAAMTVDLAIKNIQAIFNLQKQGLIWYGERHLKIGSLKAHSPKSQSTSISHLQLSLKQTQQNKKTTVVLQLQANAIHSPKIHLGTSQLTLNLKSLDSSAWQHFIYNAKSLGQLQYATTQTQWPTLVQPAIALISKGLAINLKNLHLNTPNGAVIANASFDIPKQTGKQNLISLTGKSTGQIELQMPKSWLLKQISQFYSHHLTQSRLSTEKHTSSKQLAEKTVDNWIADKTLLQANHHLLLKLELKNGALSINGKSSLFRFVKQRTNKTG